MSLVADGLAPLRLQAIDQPLIGWGVGLLEPPAQRPVLDMQDWEEGGVTHSIALTTDELKCAALLGSVVGRLILQTFRRWLSAAQELWDCVVEPQPLHRVVYLLRHGHQRGASASV
jgi:hypothetical protein